MLKNEGYIINYKVENSDGKDSLLIDLKYNPSYFLFMDVNPKSIDINIHPTKTEIKFDDEHSIYAILRSAIKHSLGQFNIAPILDFNHDKNMELPYSYRNKKVVEGVGIDINENYNPFQTTNIKSSENIYLDLIVFVQKYFDM